MPQRELWSAVDHYLSESVVKPDAALDAALAASESAGLPAISVSAAQGKLLHLLARMVGARRILEIGTLGGYSAIWMARGLEGGGKLITLEFDARHAQVARENFVRAKLADRIELIEGKAIESLPKLEQRGDKFELVFIDADKVSTMEYFQWSLKLVRSGSVIVVDNVIRSGAIIDEKSTDASVLAIRKFNEMLSKESRVDATAIQTVGSKGYDGFTIAVVK